MRGTAAPGAAPAPLDASPVAKEGFAFPPIYEAGRHELRLHGTALYRAYFMKVYVGALYLEPGTAPDNALQDVSKRLELRYLRPVPAEALRKHTLKGIRANCTPETYEHIRDDVETLARLFVDAAKGDRFALTYVARKGLQLEHNGAQTAVFTDPLFVRTLFSVWLGAHPLSEGFKAGVLAQPEG